MTKNLSQYPTKRAISQLRIFTRQIKANTYVDQTYTNICNLELLGKVWKDLLIIM